MATMAASFVGTDIWNAEMYETMSTTSRMSAAIKDGRNLLKVRWALMRLNHNLGTFFDKFFSMIEAAQRGTLPHVDEPATPEQIQRAIDSLWNLHHSLIGINESSKRKGLKKKSLTCGQVSILENNTERLVDMIQWITDISSPQEIQALSTVFEQAMEEFERRETVTIR